MFLIADHIEQRLANLEEIIKKVDLESIEGDVAELKKKTISKPIKKYINEFRKEWEEYKAWRDSYLSENR